ncbi:uncharacterized protein [Nicotiana tomentosiformis]|uniref:uncharacterized protein n=1 Tax=Nicotiana tomentosiformis TaxID=4098 RepID=UPI00388CA920
MGQELVPKAAGGMESLPMTCASRIGQPLQIQLNVPLKNPIHVLHGIVTHNVSPLDMHNVMLDQMQLEEEVDDESTVGGDFNVVIYEDEKIGGLPIYPPEFDELAFCVNSSGLFDLGYKGSPFTWWNGRPNTECIFKSMKHFKEVVKQTWVADFIRDIFFMFKQKLKRVKIALSTRSKVTYGGIFKQLTIREDIVRVKEILFEEEPTIENRIVPPKAQAELKKYSSIEEQYWKQKEGMAWFAKGDRNSMFFHNHVNGKRQKLQLKRIQNSDGVLIEMMGGYNYVF